MSGTSLDGVDAASLETDGHRVVAFGPSCTIPYDDGLRADLRRILERAPNLDHNDRHLASVVARLTDYHARAVLHLNCRAHIIGFHGQTILHRPDFGRTWQIGDAQELARRTGIPVVHDFRSADMAAGGQGAPLVPVFHAALARELPKPLAVVNIGGVANVTWIGENDRLVAFDTGPGNGPLDDWVREHTGQPFDRDGHLAKVGVPDRAVLNQLLSHRYFSAPPPKSLDRLDFTKAIDASGIKSLSAQDGAATLVAFITDAIAKAPLPEPPLQWLITGGGRHNPVIIEGLRAALMTPVNPVETVGWNGDALEAQCFAFLATRVAAGLPTSFPETTGAMAPIVGGVIVEP